MISNHIEPERRPFDGQQDPDRQEFVVDPWLHPSTYTAVPDPACPAGQQLAQSRQAEAQLTVIRKAAAASYGSPDYSSALRPADPGWPAEVRTAWESYQRAQATADGHIDAASHQPQAWPCEGKGNTAWWEAHSAGRDADVAYEEFSMAWRDWQFGHEMTGPEEPEAGS